MIIFSAMLFSGKDNAIFFTREYYQDYGCHFDLRFYPFDTQMCQMIFEIQGKTDNYVRFVRDGDGIEFRSKNVVRVFKRKQPLILDFLLSRHKIGRI